MALTLWIQWERHLEDGTFWQVRVSRPSRKDVIFYLGGFGPQEGEGVKGELGSLFPDATIIMGGVIPNDATGGA